jgi:N-methylhydantoinase A/oxoprolinase/acetone carboxylase beta subunit
VSHFDGIYERTFETQVAGVRLWAPTMRINKVAAGGSSILHFDGTRFRVAANAKGVEELRRMVRDFGRPMVEAYMSHVQDNAEEAGASSDRPVEGQSLHL